MDRPKIRKRIMTVIKDTWGVIRIIETYDDNYIKYYVQSAYNKDIFISRIKPLTPDLIYKLEKSKKIGDITEIKKIRNNEYNIKWNI